MKGSWGTWQASVSKSTKVEDNNLPVASACTTCHTNGAPAIKAPRAAHIAKFSHAQHLAMGNVAPLIAAAIDKKTYLSPPGDLRAHLNSKNACEGCHRGLESSEAGSDAAFPQMADCLVCHTKIEPPYSCEICHANGVNLMPASHDSKWLDFHSSGKAKLDRPSCALCQGRQSTCRRSPLNSKSGHRSSRCCS